jgi:hypothetical protein
VDGGQLTLDDELRREPEGAGDDGSWEWWWISLPKIPPDQDDLEEAA